jgi:short-subunit dehydrogenase
MYLITGASSGLGAALAHLYAAQGSKLCLTGRDEAKLSGVVASIGAALALTGSMTTESGAHWAQHNIDKHCANLQDPKSVSALLDRLPQALEMVLHCAGSGYFGPLDEQGTDNIQGLIDNNLTSTIFLLRELIKRYQDEPIRVVVVMSTAALGPKAGESTYCAVKWAVKGLVESLRLELKGKAMKLIAVYPGGMATEFWQTSGKNIDTQGFMSSDEAALMIKQALTSTEHGYVSDITVNRG